MNAGAFRFARHSFDWLNCLACLNHYGRMRLFGRRFERWIEAWMAGPFDGVKTVACDCEVESASEGSKSS